MDNDMLGEYWVPWMLLVTSLLGGGGDVLLDSDMLGAMNVAGHQSVGRCG